jgi:hypothetical protein
LKRLLFSAARRPILFSAGREKIMNIRIFQFIRWLPIAVLMFAGSACNLTIATRSAVAPQFIVVTATGTTGQSVPLSPSSTLEPTIPPTPTMTFTPTLTATFTKPPVTMTAGQTLSCVKGPQWILYEWVTSIQNGETVTLLARSAPEWPDYFYVRKSDGTECWAFGGSSTKNGDVSALPVQEAPPLPVITFTIGNKMYLPIMDVFIRGKDETAWGADRLGAGHIAPGATFSLTLTAGFYDVQMKDFFGGVLFEKHDTPIGSESSSRNIYPESRFSKGFRNASANNLCRVVVHPASGGSAVTLTIPGDGIIAPGETIALEAIAGNYDLWIYRCGDDHLVYSSGAVYIGPLSTTLVIA